MLKKTLLSFFILFVAVFAFSQEKVPVEVIGKDKGSLSVIRKDGQTFVSAQEISKVLRLQTSWFGRSGQLNVRGKEGFFCILRDGSDTAPVNGKDTKLPAAAFAQGGDLYVPLSFFTVGGAGAAAGAMDVAFDQSKVTVEKRFNLELLSNDFNDSSATFTFNQKGKVKREVNPKDKEKIDIFFPGATVKREGTFDDKTKFIRYARIKQHYDGVSMSVLLTKNASFWDVYEDGSKLIFAAADKKIERISQPIALPAPSVTADAADTDGLPAPSVVEEGKSQEISADDFFAGLPVKDADTSIEAAPPATVINKLPSSVVSIDKRPVKRLRKARVLIDPGHGGKDSGAVRRGIREKDINLKVATRLYDLLVKDRNFDVKMSRNTDVFIPLSERPEQANDFKADIFVSIHSNAAKRSSANGFEVYFRSDKASDAEAAETAALENEALKYDGQGSAKVTFADLLLKSLATNENINESSKLAGHIRNSVADRSKSLGIHVYNNSIKQANFYVLRGVQIPAVLVEMGYLSNTTDRKRLNSSSTQKKIAEYIKDGIASYAKAEGWN